MAENTRKSLGSIEQKIEVLENSVEQYIKDIFGSSEFNDEEFDKIKNIGFYEILSISPVDCVAFAYCISNRITNLKSKKLKLESKIEWCKHALSYIYAMHWDEYDRYYPTEIRQKLILKENSVAQKLFNIIESVARVIKIVDECINELESKKSILLKRSNIKL